MADRDTIDDKFWSSPMVGVDQHPDRKPAGCSRKLPGGGADAAFEAEAAHARAAADIAFLDGAGRGCVDGLHRRFRLYMEAFDIVETAVIGFGDNGPQRTIEILRGPLLDAGIDLANGVGVADADGAIDNAEILQIGLARHLAVTIEVVEAAADGP